MNMSNQINPISISEVRKEIDAIKLHHSSEIRMISIYDYMKKRNTLNDTMPALSKQNAEDIKLDAISLINTIENANAGGFRANLYYSVALLDLSETIPDSTMIRKYALYIIKGIMMNSAYAYQTMDLDSDSFRLAQDLYYHYGEPDLSVDSFSSLLP